MRYDHPVARTAFVLFVLAAVPAAYSPALDQRAIDAAIAIGQSHSDATRERFHLTYRLPVARAPVDYIDIVTPFRRLVIAAEERARIGDRHFAQRDAHALLDQHAGGIDVVVELTFHPFNTYVGVPDYDLTLETAGRVVRARGLQRLPRFTPRVAGLPVPGVGVPNASQPLLGAAVIGRFDRTDLEVEGVYDVVIREGGKELARGTITLGTLR